jgi:hypothetical protein
VHLAALELIQEIVNRLRLWNENRWSHDVAQ